MKQSTNQSFHLSNDLNTTQSLNQSGEMKQNHQSNISIHIEKNDCVVHTTFNNGTTSQITHLSFFLVHRSTLTICRVCFASLFIGRWFSIADKRVGRRIIKITTTRPKTPTTPTTPSKITTASMSQRGKEAPSASPSLRRRRISIHSTPKLRRKLERIEKAARGTYSEGFSAPNTTSPPSTALRVRGCGRRWRWRRSDHHHDDDDTTM